MKAKYWGIIGRLILANLLATGMYYLGAHGFNLEKEVALIFAIAFLLHVME